MGAVNVFFMVEKLHDTQLTSSNSISIFSVVAVPVYVTPTQKISAVFIAAHLHRKTNPDRQRMTDDNNN